MKRRITSRRWWHTIVSVLLIGGVLMVFFGPMALAKEVEITWLHRSTDAPTAAFHNWVVSEFNKEFEGRIHVTYTEMTDEVYKVKQKVVLASTDPPDVYFTWEGGRNKFLVDAGHCEPLDRYYEKYGWYDIMAPATVELSRFYGKLYSVPIYVAVSLIYYRPDIFEQYGLLVPKTWQEFLMVCEELKNNDIYPLLMTNVNKWPSQFWWTYIEVLLNGIEHYQALLDNKIPWTDPGVVKAFRCLRELVDKGYFAPGINAMDLADGALLFIQGRAAMWLQGSWMVRAHFEPKPGKPIVPYSFFSVPQINPAVSPTLEAFNEETLAMHPKSKHKDEAAELLNFYVSAKVQQKMSCELFRGNVNTTVDLSTAPQWLQNINALRAQYGDYTFMHVDHAFHPEIATSFLDLTQALVGKQISPEKCAQGIEETAIRVRGSVE